MSQAHKPKILLTQNHSYEGPRSAERFSEYAEKSGSETAECPHQKNEELHESIIGQDEVRSSGDLKNPGLVKGKIDPSKTCPQGWHLFDP